MVSCRWRCWYEMLRIFATAVFQLSLDSCFEKDMRMPSILTSCKDFASGILDWVDWIRSLELESMFVLEEFSFRLVWREKSLQI